MWCSSASESTSAPVPMSHGGDAVMVRPIGGDEPDRDTYGREPFSWLTESAAPAPAPSMPRDMAVAIGAAREVEAAPASASPREVLLSLAVLHLPRAAVTPAAGGPVHGRQRPRGIQKHLYPDRSPRSCG